MSREYDEQSVLTKYVLDNFGHLLNEEEKRVQRVHLALQKAATWTDRATRVEELEKSWGFSFSPYENQDLPALLDTARKRILQEHAEIVMINRCPKCTRIVRTPQAQQCFWCGHDWHDSAS